MHSLFEFIVQRGLDSGAYFCESRYFEERINSVDVENGIAKRLSSGILRGRGKGYIWRPLGLRVNKHAKYEGS